MLNTSDSERQQDQNQEEFCPGQRFSHGKQYPFIDEFSELLARVSTEVLKFELMTHQQRMMAQGLWEANNYGGSEAKCAKHLNEIYGPKWRKITKIEDHMEPIRSYYEYVVLLDHQRQWDNQKKFARLPQNDRAT